MSFENVIGNKQNKELLKNIIKTNNIAHSYMFVGKDSIRKIFVCKRVCKRNIMYESRKTMQYV